MKIRLGKVVKDLANTFGHPIRSPILRWPEEYGLKYETVFFPSIDGIPLEGWFFPADSDKLIIANHPLWFNRYGFPAHLEPWKQIGAAGGNDFEVNFMPDYKHLHDAATTSSAMTCAISATAVRPTAASVVTVSSSPVT